MAARLWTRIKEHPVTAGIVLLVSILGGADVLLEWSRRFVGLLAGSPVILRVLVAVILLAVIGAALWMMGKIIVLVRGLPAELKTENAEFKQLLANAREENAALFRTNTDLGRWRETNRAAVEEHKESASRINDLTEKLARSEELRLASEEKDALAKLRHVWRQEDGHWSAEALSSLLAEALYDHKKPHLARLVDSIRPKLDAAAKAVDNALEFDALAPAVNAFNALYAEFLESAKLLYQMHASKDIDLSSGKLLRELQRFRHNNARFREKLMEATEYPGLVRKLHVFPGQAAMIDNAAQWRFIGVYPWGDDEPPGLDGRPA